MGNPTVSIKGPQGENPTYKYGGEMGNPQNGWFVMENP
jgi:hypothetical protein